MVTPKQASTLEPGATLGYATARHGSQQGYRSGSQMALRCRLNSAEFMCMGIAGVASNSPLMAGCDRLRSLAPPHTRKGHAYKVTSLMIGLDRGIRNEVSPPAHQGIFVPKSAFCTKTESSVVPVSHSALIEHR